MNNLLPENTNENNFNEEEYRCLVPENYGVHYEDNDSWRKSLWDKYYMQMPEQQRQSVERYVIEKRA